MVGSLRVVCFAAPATLSAAGASVAFNTTSGYSVGPDGGRESEGLFASGTTTISPMGFKDIGEKRRVDREWRRAQRAQLARKPKLAGSQFPKWLSATVRLFGSEIAGARRESWSAALREAMGKKSGYESSLRRIEAGGDRAVRETTAFDIGEGLNACGLQWCSGLLALHGGRYVADEMGLFDVISGDSERLVTRVGLCEWFVRAEDLTQDIMAGKPPSQFTCEWLMMAQRWIREDVQRGFMMRLRGSTRVSNGQLGIAYQILRDKRSGPTAMKAAVAVVQDWCNDAAAELRENGFDPRRNALLFRAPKKFSRVVQAHFSAYMQGPHL